jgi:hypothetical protein
LEEARKLVGIFDRLRSLYPADYLCLFDSLALLEFLSRYKLFPSWVFAIRPAPWGAHCWVQDACTIFNDDPYNVLEYLPIMQV